MIRLLRYACAYEKVPGRFLYYCSTLRKGMEDFKDFKTEFEAEYIPLYISSGTWYWNASLSGKTEDWEKYEEISKKINKLLSNKESFARLKAIKESASVKDAIAKREIELMYLAYLGCQVDSAKLDKVTTMSANIEKKFNVFRTEYKDKRLTDNDILEILKKSTDSAELEGIWTAQKKIALEVATELKDLVKLRNEIAKELGFKNYHDMSLRLSEQDPEAILKLFNELDDLTKDMFKVQKEVVDKVFSEKYKISKEELKPWHYQDLFFQKAPSIYKVDLDKFFKGKNLEEITTKFYASIGLDITDVLKRSDLYQKEGKSQHAYCISINRGDDIRVLCNNVDNYMWMSTMLHEFGHSLYDKYVDNTLPFMLHEPAHTFTTEAIALMFEELTKRSSWIKLAVEISKEEQEAIDSVSKKTFVLDQLVFSRWSQVMFRFEKTMYEDPDQDLNTLWWNMIEKFQLLKKPAGRNAPDWASKIHIATAPCYYHNYLMGQLLGAQLNHRICTNILKTDKILESAYGPSKEVGAYLKENVFAPGRKYPWWEMIKRATEEELTAKYYAKQLAEGMK